MHSCVALALILHDLLMVFYMSIDYNLRYLIIICESEDVY